VPKGITRRDIKKLLVEIQTDSFKRGKQREGGQWQKERTVTNKKGTNNGGGGDRCTVSKPKKDADPEFPRIKGIHKHRGNLILGEFHGNKVKGGGSEQNRKLRTLREKNLQEEILKKLPTLETSVQGKKSHLNRAFKFRDN